MYDVVIIGGGPAGITASIYCKRANLNVCIIDKSVIGGNPINYSEIENYPGFYGTTFDLIEKLRDHLEHLKIPVFEFETIEYIDLKNKIVKTENSLFESKYIILATGSKPKKLGIEGEEEFFGHGVHYCGICDGPQYKDKKVAVIGGGNSACEEALGLSKICETVDIIEFTDKLNADKITLDKIYNTKNISVHLNCSVTKIEGNNKVNRIWFRDRLNKEIESSYDCYLDIDAIFPYIGMSPNLPDLIGELSKDKFGYINTDCNMETSSDGIYAVGDITHKQYRQVITAMSDGAIAGIHISKR